MNTNINQTLKIDFVKFDQIFLQWPVEKVIAISVILVVCLLVASTFKTCSRAHEQAGEEISLTSLVVVLGSLVCACLVFAS